ncbi:MAG: lipid-A-disaccharide synthase, partial [Pseudomonadales bacterium]|nr:lipid-A-disaccharide synthase [Pseudomonadales bacterium]
NHGSGPLTIGVLAGEASGDNLGAGMMRACKARNPDVRFIGVGGEAMQAEGLESLFDMDVLSVNGFREPILRFPELLGRLLELRRVMLAERPTAFVGVDFNVFNLLLERQLKKHGIPTIHYVSPSVYAWRRGRVKRIGRSADALLALYPFEAAFYSNTEVSVHFVGHPLADAIEPDAGNDSNREAARQRLGLASGRRVVALLPGSRGSELVNMLPVFLGAAEILAEEAPTSFVVPCPRAVLVPQLRQALDARTGLDVLVYEGDGREALTAADAALVKSGTSTLEAMMLRRPMVVSYRLGPLAAKVARMLIKTEFIALPNILAGRALVPELLQDDATPAALAENLLAELYKAEHEPEYLAEFQRLHAALRQDANEHAAEAVLDTIEEHDGRLP